ncbi:MAG: hypothetical protein BWX83_01143 [Candidatus Cloacimonetes bacterium ADurb.Bin117]|nr:MAG: hypothetical protein BWX83_01143 [Candidatus Cloacimonetes bacterium ADurb.Bin117]
MLGTTWIKCMGAEVVYVILGMDDPFRVVHIRARSRDPVGVSGIHFRFADEGVVEGCAIGSSYWPGGAGIGSQNADDVNEGITVEETQAVVAVEIGDGVGHVRDTKDGGVCLGIGDHEYIIVSQGSGKGHAVGGGPGRGTVGGQLHGIIGQIDGGSGAVEDLDGFVV